MKKMKRMKQMKKIKSQQLGVVALVTFVVAMALMVVGLSNTMGEIDQIAISKSPTVILANAGLSEDKDVFLSVAYFDRRSDECTNVYDSKAKEALVNRQFEWNSCKYYNKEVEQGLVENTLSEEYLPVATGNGKLVPNQGLKDIDSWFKAVEGKSKNYTGTLKLGYQATGAEFAFFHDNFYPLDGAEFSDGDPVNKDGHNHLWTMDFAVPFTVLASGNEEFVIRADDDTFVYIGDKLVLDMGGVHDAVTGRFVIQANGEVYAAVGKEGLAYSGIKLDAGDGSIMRIFHADRDSAGSVFEVRIKGMNISITDAKLANRKDDGVQIAYDPTDPSYVAPLGETSVVKPDGTKGYIIMATVEGVMVIVFAVLMAAALRSVVRRKLLAREKMREAEKMTSQQKLTGKK